MFNVPFSPQSEAEMEASVLKEGSERSTLHTLASPSSLMSHKLFIHAKLSRHKHIYTLPLKMMEPVGPPQRE